MLYSPKIIRKYIPDEDLNRPLTLEIRHNFNLSQESQESIDYSETGRKIIADAQKEAEQLLARTQKEAQENAEKMADRAEKEGYQQGLEKGRQEALEQARAEADKIRDEAREVLSQAEQERARTLGSMEKEIIALSVDIAERIIAQQLSLDGDTVISIAREAIQLAQNTKRVNLFFNPADSNAFENYEQELQRLIPVNASMVLVHDKAISPGSCIVETEHGRIEATLDSRWQAILNSLGVGSDTQ
ncbi:MAG: hypothetical protein FH756_19450 [Firmicutes bacterium]|nr:hypothetical protein [Bacillota bacterium]